MAPETRKRAFKGGSSREARGSHEARFERPLLLRLGRRFDHDITTRLIALCREKRRDSSSWQPD